jgi:hypothetical protein
MKHNLKINGLRQWRETTLSQINRTFSTSNERKYKITDLPNKNIIDTNYSLIRELGIDQLIKLKTPVMSLLLIPLGLIINLYLLS